jgi:TatD DNase family protein
MVDIGVNLSNKRFANDIEQVLARAQQAGIDHILVTGTSITESQRASELAERDLSLLSATAGIHPHHAEEFSAEALSELAELAQLPQVRAIGETGLDFNRNFSSPEQQLIAFEKHIELAAKTGLPLFMHERDAHQKQWQILKYYRDDFSNGVIHCFTGSREQAYNYLDLDLSLGITGWICDPVRGQTLRELIGDIPLHKLLLETDAPYLLPKLNPKPKPPKSGRNEPCLLPLIAQEIAHLRGMAVAELCSATRENAKLLFGLPLPRE